MRNTDLFGGLPDTALEAVAGITVSHRAKEREILFLEEDPADAMYLLTEGAVQLHRTTEDGRVIVLKVILPGESFAEAILFEQDRYPATAVALKPSRLLLIPRGKVMALLDDRDFRRSFLGALMTKLRYLADRIPYLTSRDVAGRLVVFLKESFGQSDTLTVTLSKKDVAAAIGTNPETLSRCLARLRKAGLLTWRGHQVAVSSELWDRL